MKPIKEPITEDKILPINNTEEPVTEDEVLPINNSKEPVTEDEVINPILMKQLLMVGNFLNQDINGTIAFLLGIADSLANNPELANAVLLNSKLQDGTLTEEEAKMLNEEVEEVEEEEIEEEDEEVINNNKNTTSTLLYMLSDIVGIPQKEVQNILNDMIKNNDTKSFPNPKELINTLQKISGNNNNSNIAPKLTLKNPNQIKKSFKNMSLADIDKAKMNALKNLKL